MAKGKKTVIKEIIRINDNEISINGKEYILLEKVDNVESATTMKISSNGNRILRFEDESKKARIDVKRNIDIIKITFTDVQRAVKFKKGQDKSLITAKDSKRVIDTASSFSSARNIINTYTTKGGDNYDSLSGKATFYLYEEVK